MIELSYIIAFIFAFLSCVRLLHLTSIPEWPELFSHGSQLNLGKTCNTKGNDSRANACKDGESHSFVTQILENAPLFTRPYIPPLIWGRSGHLQTILHSTIKRFKTPQEKGDSRHAILLSDGSTVTFDVFLPFCFSQDTTKVLQDVTLVVCPGIGNSSESLGIRTFSQLANSHGYRVAVLNHLGVITDIPLTSPRIFSYGSTEEYGAVVDKVISMYPNTILVAVGFSMGANLICKYLGESRDHMNKITAAVSCCQGYDINRSLGLLQTWKHLRYGYLRAVHVCVKKILHNFQDVVLTEEVLKRYGLKSREEVLEQSSLTTVDSMFLSKLAGYGSVEEYYRCSSSSVYIPEISIPILYINSRDDPLIPVETFDVPMHHTALNSKALFVITKYGGHLGFYESEEGSRLFAHGVYTWLDKAVIQYIGAVLLVTAQASSARVDV
ncbi:abhydrolase domain-containing protein 2-like [Watersipora subatra]|uniref:abhydrolase domain-containing protein 2-like n=1 Tax=Watersipora subatra TaxID=2589382 RepID=UPI00355B2E92